VEGTVREVKRRVRVVSSSYRAIDRSVTRWIVVTMVEWSSEVRWEFVSMPVIRLSLPRDNFYRALSILQDDLCAK